MDLRAAVLFCVLPLPAAAVPPAPAERVVVITVDGLRPDALERAGARRLLALVRESATSLEARVTERPETLPSHATMATGLPASLHGVDWNRERDLALERPTLFTRVREAGGRTGLYYGKSKLRMLAPGADVLFGPGPGPAHPERGRVEAVAQRFARDFPRERFRFAWVHLREPDGAGHREGWMSAPYLEAVRRADAAVGVLLDAIAASGLADLTAVLVTADHGGEGTNHGADRGPASWRIPWICHAPGMTPAAIAEPPSQLDVAPTVLAWLALPPLPDMRGRVVKECLP